MKHLAIFFVLVFGCASKEKYDVNRYFDASEQDQLLASIVTYISDAPPLATMEDRFNPEHRNYYSFRASKFRISKYFLDEKSGTHYFYLIRPTSNPKEKRGVGGKFTMREKYRLENFREVFVTPALPEADVEGRCAFLFDEMIKNSINQYVDMRSFIQWPNPASYYDTLTYEWKLKGP